MTYSEYDLPVSVKIGETILNIRNECDYRVVLDVISALTDNKLTDNEKIECALYIFYENSELLNESNAKQALQEMYSIISCGEQEADNEGKPQLMDWQKDFRQIAPPVNRVLGYEIRTPNKYTHWWTLIGAYMEIGDCTFATIVSIRSKKAKGKKLDKWEEDFYRENINLVSLPQKYSAEEEEFMQIFEQKEA